MMPGVGFEEMILLVIAAIVVIGPKDLPLMMRKFGRFTGKMRALAFEFRQGMDELGRQAELEELRKEVADLKKVTGLDEIRRDLEADKANFERDVASALNDQPKPAASTEAKEPAPYAGLSADHPGYDAGDDFRIDGASPQPRDPAPGGAAVDPAASSEPASVEPMGAVHIIPDDEVRPTHPAMASVPVKQDTPA